MNWGNAIWDEVRKTSKRLFGTASVLVISLYALGYIYLKSYLDVFSIDMVSVDLSPANLILSHRYFVAMHMATVGGIVLGYVRVSYPDKFFKEHPFHSFVLFSLPIILLIAANSLASWSESHVLKGYNASNFQLSLIAFPGGYVSGYLFFIVTYLSVIEPKDSPKKYYFIVAAIIAFGALIASYRYHGHASATYNKEHKLLPRVESLTYDDEKLSYKESCGLIYIDGKNIFLECADSKIMIVDKSHIIKYQLKESE